jgi:hypothetical protein
MPSVVVPYLRIANTVGLGEAAVLRTGHSVRSSSRQQNEISGLHVDRDTIGTSDPKIALSVHQVVEEHFVDVALYESPGSAKMATAKQLALQAEIADELD